LLILTTTARAAADERLAVCVSILPQQYFVQQIGGDHVNVQVMVLPGANPATYEPRPRQMADLSRARLYFAIGVPFEAVWLDKIVAANPAMQVIHTERGIHKRSMAEHRHHDGAGDDRDGHPQGIPDPHIWLSPPLVKQQAGIILAALKAADPARTADYERNGQLFFAAIDRLDRDLMKIFADRQGAQFMVFHPSWGYFAEAYGLEQVPIEFEGKDPKPAQLQGLIEYARKHQISVIFAQPQFSRRSAAIVAGEIGGRVVVADPLALNWLDNLRAVADQFAAALR
jgi:zinc transport system substrate-binding protein